jgi:hypothetical protein
MSTNADRQILFDDRDECTAKALTAALVGCGLRVERSFDLRSVLAARAAHAARCPRQAAPSDCGCELRGTPGCNCQYAVWLVYGDGGAPITVTMRSRAGLARVEIVSPMSGTSHDGMPLPDPHLAGRVREVLMELTTVLQTRPAHCTPCGAITTEIG